MRLQSILLWMLILFLLLLVDAKKVSKSKKTSDSSSPSSSQSTPGAGYQADLRVEEIAKLLAANKERQTIKLIDSNFTKYVQDRPRQYHAALFLTASGKKYDCMVCKNILKLYKQAARNYRDNYPNLVTTAPENRMVFFVLGMRAYDITLPPILC